MNPHGNPFLFRMDSQLRCGAELSTSSHHWTANKRYTGPLPSLMRLFITSDSSSWCTATSGALALEQGVARGSSPRPPSSLGGVFETLLGSCSCSRAQAQSCSPGGAASERRPLSGGNDVGWRPKPVKLYVYPAPGLGPPQGLTPYGEGA